MQCVAKTKLGKPCAYAAQPGSKVCGHHIVKEEQPWDVLHLPIPSTLIRKNVVSKLKTKLRSFPLSSTTGGTIYIYFLAKERGEEMWKIGFTIRDVNARMAEWANVHDTVVILKRSYAVQHSAALREKIIFYYLDHCRIYRYPSDSDKSIMYKDVWSATGKVYKQQQQAVKDSVGFVAKNKHTEWFHAPLNDILDIVERVIKL